MGKITENLRNKRNGVVKKMLKEFLAKKQ